MLGHRVLAALLRGVRAKILARRGELDEARRLAGESVALADATDYLHPRWQTRMSGAEALRIAGDAAEARRVAGEAERLAELKGSVVGARAARALLETLAAGMLGGGRPGNSPGRPTKQPVGG